MKLQYVGNGVEDPVSVKIYGYEFALNGNPVEIKDEKIAKKLSGNPTFRVVDETEAKAAPTATGEKKAKGAKG